MTPRTDGASIVRAIAFCVVAVLTFSSCDADGAGPDAETERPTAPSTAPTTPSFRFKVTARRIEATNRGRLAERDRRRVRGVLDAVAEQVTELYVAGFLDPAGWGTGDYDAVFDVFAGGARGAARARAQALTAGPDAAQRFASITGTGRLLLRALVDRTGAATLVSSVVRFRARAEGDEPAVLRSEATYLFRRTAGGWRIVAFDVVRRDRERAA